MMLIELKMKREGHNSKSLKHVHGCHMGEYLRYNNMQKEISIPNIDT